MTGQPRVMHDAAMAMAACLVERVGGCLREEECKDAFEEFYRVCVAGLEAYEIQLNRIERRLKPLDN
jgi:hypothetical protein